MTVVKKKLLFQAMENINVIKIIKQEWYCKNSIR